MERKMKADYWVPCTLSRRKEDGLGTEDCPGRRYNARIEKETEAGAVLIKVRYKRGGREYVAQTWMQPKWRMYLTENREAGVIQAREEAWDVFELAVKADILDREEQKALG